MDGGGGRGDNKETKREEKGEKAEGEGRGSPEEEEEEEEEEEGRRRKKKKKGGGQEEKWVGKTGGRPKHDWFCEEFGIQIGVGVKGGAFFVAGDE